MKKRTWTVAVAGYRNFQMVLLDGALNYSQALIEARCIWPTCEVLRDDESESAGPQEAEN